MATAERKMAWTPRLMTGMESGPEIGYAQIGELHYDWLRWTDGHAEGYQRPLDETRVERYLAVYDSRLVRAVVCSRRKNGSLYVLDGQHTCEIERRVGHEVVRVEIYSGLTPAEEASIYNRLNHDRRTPNKWNSFGARASSGDPVVLAVSDLARTAGFRVGTPDRSLNCIAAVGVLERIYLLPDGPRLLKAVLGLVRDMWPSGVASRDGVFIEGLSRFLYTWDGSWYAPAAYTIDHARLRDILSRTDANEVVRIAKRIRFEHGLVMNATTYALAFRDIYNGSSRFSRRLSGKPVTPSRQSDGATLHRSVPSRRPRS